MSILSWLGFKSTEENVKDIMKDIKKSSKSEYPKPGEQWAFLLNKDEEGDPFPPKKKEERYFIVNVLQVKEGWVRFGFDKVGGDQRKSVKDFMRQYSHYADAEVFEL